MSNEATQNLLIEQILRQGELLREKLSIDQWSTIYIGGGTPSVLSENQWKRLSSLWFSPGDEIDECTVEINPESLTPEKLKVYKDTGVNRISMGIQSFKDETLERMGRPGGLAEVEKALELLDDLWPGRLSGDLIYGYPGTDSKDWIEDLNRFSRQGLNHLSLYQLTFEEGTELSRKTIEPNKNIIKDRQDDCWPDLLKRIEELGYRRYEVSNFTKDLPSFHNRRYWNLDSWVGLGPGASSFVADARGGIHYHNPGDISAYLSMDKPEWGNSYFSVEKAHGKDYLLEALMMGLRHKGGVNFRKVSEKRISWDILEPEIDNMIKQGFCLWKGENLTPTGKGLDFHNRLLLQLMKHL